MDYKEAVEYYDSLNGRGMKFGLDRIRLLMNYLDDPDKALRIIHVAGTNGKGSIIAFTSSILLKAGYRVGAYTSPHLLRVNETIRIGNENISDNDFARITFQIKELIEGEQDLIDAELTSFEILTVVALLYFKENKCDFVLLEAGLGGGMDATNVIDSPLISVITKIALDHVGILGHDLESIAREKAGIIKKNSIIVLSSQDYPEVSEIVIERCQDLRSQLIQVDRSNVIQGHRTGVIQEYRSGVIQEHINNVVQEHRSCVIQEHRSGVIQEHINNVIQEHRRGVIQAHCNDVNQADSNNSTIDCLMCPSFGQVFNYKNYQNIQISLLGTHQVYNAATAIEIISALVDSGVKINEKDIFDGLIDAYWPCRLELLRTNPMIIIDAAHNVDGVQALVDYLRLILTNIGNNLNQKITFIFGVLKDKNYIEMIEKIAPLAERVITVTPNNNRAIGAAKLAEIIRGYGVESIACYSVHNAIKELGEQDSVICIFGSLFYVGEAREIILKM